MGLHASILAVGRASWLCGCHRVVAPQCSAMSRQEVSADGNWCCRLSAFLDHVECGEYVVQGDIEAYSCKP